MVTSSVAAILAALESGKHHEVSSYVPPQALVDFLSFLIVIVAFGLSVEFIIYIVKSIVRLWRRKK